MKEYQVLKLETDSPSDVSKLQELIVRKKIKADQIMALMNMTEGDGFARGYATLAYSVLLAKELKVPLEQVAEKIPLIMIGGCSGLVTPYSAVFICREVGGKPAFPQRKRLALGVSVTRHFLPEEQGGSVQIEEVKRAVREAMKQADIKDVKDVHCVQVKGPWLTPTRIGDAERRGKKVITTNLDLAGAYSRGASALGVAAALGEISDAKAAKALLKDLTVHSRIASTSSGTERTNCAVIVLGNSASSASHYTIGHGVMKDGVDIQGVLEAIESAGVEIQSTVDDTVRSRIDHVFVKSAVDGKGSCRGRRHVLTSDYLAPYSWLLGKAVIHATVTSIIGDPMMQVSGGYEHQGPLGGGLVCIIAKAEDGN